MNEIFQSMFGDDLEIKVIDKNKDWNLAEKWEAKVYDDEVSYCNKDVKKCKRLIKKDINTKIKNRVDFHNCIMEIIDKRFGDL